MDCNLNHINEQRFNLLLTFCICTTDNLPHYSKSLCHQQGLIYALAMEKILHGIVFQPPSPPSYIEHAGVMTFHHDFSVRDPPFPNLSRSEIKAAVSHHCCIEARCDKLHHPIEYLQTSEGNRIPLAFFSHPDAYFTILLSHVRHLHHHTLHAMSAHKFYGSNKKLSLFLRTD